MENIQKIIYINLDYRVDRKTEIEDEFKRVNIPEEKIIRFSAISLEDRGVACVYSHADAIKLAKELNLDNVLILEDDFNFIQNVDTINQNLISFFRDIKEWDVLLFSKGMNILKPVNDYLSICKETSNACGYLINKHMFDILIEDFEKAAQLLQQTGMHWLYQNDQTWNKFMKSEKWFCFNQHLGYQRKSYSDLSKVVVFYENCYQ